MDQVKQSAVVENKTETLYPISEIFDNYQGEGVYSGTMMTFIRLAGCSVGKRYPEVDYQSREEHTFVGLETMPPKFPIYTEKCTLYDGREFPCDTDYRVKKRCTLNDLFSVIRSDIKHICITGGEPCMHNWLDEFMGEFVGRGYELHLETSGTKKIIVPSSTWVTVSPKKDVLPSSLIRADEVKVLVDKDFNPTEYIYKDLARAKPVYLHPVNFERRVNIENLKLCLKWQKMYPQFRIGPQLHKVIEMLVDERQL